MTEGIKEISIKLNNNNQLEFKYIWMTESIQIISKLKFIWMTERIKITIIGINWNFRCIWMTESMKIIYKWKNNNILFEWLKVYK